MASVSQFCVRTLEQFLWSFANETDTHEDIFDAMNFRSLLSAFCSTSVSIRSAVSAKHYSTRRRCRFTPLITTSRTSNDEVSGCDSGGGGGNSGGCIRGRGDQPSGDGWHPWISLMAATFAAHALICAPFSIATEKIEGEKKSEADPKDSGNWLYLLLSAWLSSLLSDWLPDWLPEWLPEWLVPLGLSGLLGVTNAVASKFTGRMALVSVGVFFIFLEGLRLSGKLDLNRNAVPQSGGPGGDKTVEVDVKHADIGVMGMLVSGLLCAGSFTVGFILGLGYNKGR